MKTKIWVSKAEYQNRDVGTFWLKDDKRFVYIREDGTFEKSEFTEEYLDSRDYYVVITEEELPFVRSP